MEKESFKIDYSNKQIFTESVRDAAGRRALGPAETKFEKYRIINGEAKAAPRSSPAPHGFRSESGQNAGTRPNTGTLQQNPVTTYV